MNAFIDAIAKTRRLSPQGSGVFRLKIDRGVVIIYADGRWSFRGRNHAGDAEAFLAWLKHQ